MFVVKSLPQSVAFAAGRLEVKNEILHIQSKLTESFLNEIENPPPTACAIDDAEHQGLDAGSLLGGQGTDSCGQIGYIFRKFILPDSEVRRGRVQLRLPVVL